MSLWNLNTQNTETRIAKSEPTEESSSDERQANPTESLSDLSATEETDVFIEDEKEESAENLLNTQASLPPMGAENRSLVRESNYMKKIDEITLEVMESKDEKSVKNHWAMIKSIDSPCAKPPLSIPT